MLTSITFSVKREVFDLVRRIGPPMPNGKLDLFICRFASSAMLEEEVGATPKEWRLLSGLSRYISCEVAAMLMGARWQITHREGHAGAAADASAKCVRMCVGAFGTDSRTGIELHGVEARSPTDMRCLKNTSSDAGATMLHGRR